jgi:hypothetical protein
MYDLAVPKEIAEKAVAKDKKLKWEAAKWKVLPSCFYK